MMEYRKNVAGILFDGKNILIVTKPNLGFWQFVQGGVENNENIRKSLKREIREETGIKEFDIIKELKNHHKWDWNPKLQKLRGFRGQKQAFFLVKLIPNKKIKLQKEELEDFKWILPEDLEKFTKYPPKVINEILNEIKNLRV